MNQFRTCNSFKKKPVYALLARETKKCFLLTKKKKPIRQVRAAHFHLSVNRVAGFSHYSHRIKIRCEKCVILS